MSIFSLTNTLNINMFVLKLVLKIKVVGSAIYLVAWISNKSSSNDFWLC